MDDAGSLPPPPLSELARRTGWIWPLLRVGVVFAAGFVAWIVAENWNRWTGALRYVRTDDANVAGDLTPLSAKVQGYVSKVSVTDYQVVRAGELLVEIDPSDYQAQLAQSDANLAAPAANLADIANQKGVQRALLRQAEATIRATAADMLRYHLEAQRQRDLLRDRWPGRQQAVEQADANERRTAAQLALNNAQLDQQKALLAGLDVQEKGLQAQVSAAEAQRDLAANNLGYTRITAPADGMVGQRQVHPGQFVNVGTQVIAVVPLPNLWVIANYKETQMTNVRVGQRARVVGRCLSRPGPARPRGQLVARHRQHLRAAAARQCHRQFHQGGAARAGEDRARSGPVSGHARAPGHVGRNDNRYRAEPGAAAPAGLAWEGRLALSIHLRPVSGVGMALHEIARPSALTRLTRGSAHQS